MPPPAPSPPLSVVMPVYNALPYLDAAVESILGQSFSDFEFVIFDDGSTDGSRERLDQWAAQDPRIRLCHSDANLGPAASSNRVVEQSRAPLVARMDADDVALPERLARQMRLLQDRPEAVLVGALCETLDGKGRVVRGPDYWRLANNGPFPPFPHGSVLYRRAAFDAIGGYRAACDYWEDQDFVLRMASQGEVITLPEVLYRYRHSPASGRLGIKRAAAEAYMDRMYQAFAELAAGRPYDALLAQPLGTGRVHPRVFISLGSIELWAGGRPRMFRRLLQRGRLRFDGITLAALAWTAWASLSPASLRAFLTRAADLRNRAGAPHDLEPCRWLAGPPAAPKLGKGHTPAS